MSTLRVTNIQHPNAEDPAIELSPSGGVLLSGAGDVPSGSTGVPWFLPYPEPGEAFGTQAVKDLADAVADGLDAAGGLVAVKSAIFTGVQTESVVSGANVAITGLSITHEVADVANRLVLTGTIGRAGISAVRPADVALLFAEDGTPIGIGDASSSRGRFTAGGRSHEPTGSRVTQSLAATIVITPGAGSKDYTLRLANASSGNGTVFVNRSQNDDNNPLGARTISSLVLMEVKV